MDIYQNNKAFFDRIDEMMEYDEPSPEELAEMDDAAENLLLDFLGEDDADT